MKKTKRMSDSSIFRECAKENGVNVDASLARTIWELTQNRIRLQRAKETPTIHEKFSTAKEIPGLATPGEHSDKLTPGLYLIKRLSGRHVWSWLYRFEGRQKRWTIGKLDRITLKEARHLVRKANDPVGEKKLRRLAESKVVTFSQLSDRYIKDYCKLHQRFWKQSESGLKNPRFKSWQSRNIVEIERRDVKRLLASIPGNGLANQTKSLLHGLFNFAVDDEILRDNPAARIKKRPAPPRDRVLSDEEIRAVWDVPLFRMCLLTGQRPNNVKQILRSEIDGTKWTIPAEKFKTKIVHVAPLVKTSIDTLAELPNRGDRYFTTRDCLGVEKSLADLGVPNAKPKDLQRTVRTRVGALGVDPDIAERLQGHQLLGMRNVYDKADYFEAKEKALLRWERELLRIVGYNKMCMDPDLEMTLVGREK